MKKVLLAAIFNNFFLVSFSQVSHSVDSVEIINRTNWENRKFEVKTPKGSNSTERKKATVKTDSAKTSATITDTTPTNNNNSQPMTLEELTLTVKGLESSLRELYKKLPFENMGFVTIVASNSNLFGSPSTVLRIDDSLCNNNPRAKIFLSPSSAVPIVDIYYNNPYWYASFSRIITTGYELYYPERFDLAALNTNMMDSSPIFVLKQPDLNKITKTANAILTGEPYHIESGSKFTFLIFQGLINRVQFSKKVDQNLQNPRPKEFYPKN
jgi:hypothetical protein